MDCILGSSLILVSRLYLFSFPLPFYTASRSTAWLVIFNRPRPFHRGVQFQGSLWEVLEQRGRWGGTECRREGSAPGSAGYNSDYLPYRSTLDI